MRRVSLVFAVFLIASLLFSGFQIGEVEAQESKVFGNPTLPDWLNVTVTEYSENVIIDNGDGFVWEFPKAKDKFNQIYENGTLIVKDEQWLLFGEDLKEDSHPISRLEWNQTEPYHVVVKDYYEDAKNNNNFSVTYSFYGGFSPKITLNASIGFAQNYTVDWRCWVYKSNASKYKYSAKFWDGNETGVWFEYSDVYQNFGNITSFDVEGWFKGKRFDQKFSVGFLNQTFLLDPTFGKTDIGGTWRSGVNDDCHIGSVYNLPVNGDVSKITAYLKWGGTNKYRANIYDTSGNLKGESAERTDCNADAWYDFAFDPVVSLTAANYWLQIHQSVGFFIAGDAGTTDQERVSKTDEYDDGAADPYVGNLATADYELSIYATYTTGGQTYKRFPSINLNFNLDRLVTFFGHYTRTHSITLTMNIDSLSQIYRTFTQNHAVNLLFTLASTTQKLVAYTFNPSIILNFGLSTTTQIYRTFIEPHGINLVFALASTTETFRVFIQNHALNLVFTLATTTKIAAALSVHPSIILDFALSTATQTYKTYIEQHAINILFSLTSSLEHITAQWNINPTITLDFILRQTATYTQHYFKVVPTIVINFVLRQTSAFTQHLYTISSAITIIFSLARTITGGTVVTPEIATITTSFAIIALAIALCALAFAAKRREQVKYEREE